MSGPTYDPLDAVVAAPYFHRLLKENDHVRVLATRIEPGETVPVHAHPWPAVLHIASAGHFVRRDPEGNVLLDSRMLDPPFEAPGVMWTEAIPPHSLENVGDVPWDFVSIELKDA